MNADLLSTSLGLWVNDDLKSAASVQIGIGADAELPDEVRFKSGVTKLVRRRISLGECEDNARVAIFLLKAEPESLEGIQAPQRIPMLDNGRETLSGKLWFVNAPVRSGKFIPLEEDDDDRLFTLITDHWNLGDVAAIVFDPRPSVPEVRFYPNGLNALDDCDRFAANQIDVSVGRVFEAINHVYVNHLVSPEAQLKVGTVWQNGNKFWPVEHAESVIQWPLIVGLQMAFPACIVRHEQTQVVGRSDIEIEEINLDSSRTTHIVLELKVLRKYGSTGKAMSENEVKEWVKVGVEQAAAYRDSKKAKSSALCCFDMRQEHTKNKCFEHVTDLAARLNVDLGVWHIYASSKKYRQDLAKN